jgi:UbiD family decarboxylase
VKTAPLKEVMINRDINIFKELPIFWVNDYDGGFYLSKAIVISKDPEDSENQNMGIYRLLFKDKDRLGVRQPLNMILPFILERLKN